MIQKPLCINDVCRRIAISLSGPEIKHGSLHVEVEDVVVGFQTLAHVFGRVEGRRKPSHAGHDGLGEPVGNRYRGRQPASIVVVSYSWSPSINTVSPLPGPAYLPVVSSFRYLSTLYVSTVESFTSPSGPTTTIEGIHFTP